MFFTQDKLLCPVQAQSNQGKQENNDSLDMGPKVADWRFGPAQVWYDMLEVPETGDGFNYGFKLKEEVSGTVKARFFFSSDVILS